MVSTALSKKSYSDMLGVLGPLATFAGALTIATQFIIQCPDSRLQVLLEIISLLFLASLLGTVVMYLILYGLKDGDEVNGTRRHYLILQFLLVGMMMAAAFILLAVALMVAVKGPHVVGILGICFIGILIGGPIIIGCCILFNRRRTDRDNWCDPTNWNPHCCGDLPAVVDPEDFGRYQLIFMWFLCVFEFVAILMLLGWGGHRASIAPEQYGCSNGTSVLLPSPIPTIPVSVIGEPSDPWPQITDMDEVVSETDEVFVTIIKETGWDVPTTTASTSKD